MPSVGSRKTAVDNTGYSKDPIFKLAKAFNEVAQNILNESGVDILYEPQKAMMNNAASKTMENFFTEKAIVDEDHMEADERQDAYNDLHEQFLNDKEAVLEYANVGSYNPVIGMTFPLHKNILMNNVFDKGAIPKVVAKEPKFTISMETRILTTPDGEEIDMFKEQWKMKDAINATAPFTEVTMTLPQLEGATNVLTALSATSEANVSIESYISAVKINIYLEVGDVNPETGVAATSAGAVDVWLPVKMEFHPAYGEYDRTIMENFSYDGKVLDTTVKAKTYADVITGYMKKNKFCITAMNSVIKAVKLKARIDTSSAMLPTCGVSWKVRTDIVEIPSAIPINTPVSPEEVKDIGALYNVNQLSKILSLIKTVLGNYKDDMIKDHLDDSFTTMPSTSKLSASFDFVPPGSYAFDPIEWRSKMFMDQLDTHVTNLMQVLNDPNMTVTVFGRPDLIRKVTPTEYTYQTPSNIGPVELDFVKTVVTSDKRVYQFVGSDKLRGNNNLIVILCPRNTDRIIYRIYDYQMYVSNEIRNSVNYALPAIHAFERWKFVEYQPVQGRIRILNPLGIAEYVDNTDPIGSFRTRSIYANMPETKRVAAETADRGITI